MFKGVVTMSRPPEKQHQIDREIRSCPGNGQANVGSAERVGHENARIKWKGSRGSNRRAVNARIPLWIAPYSNGTNVPVQVSFTPASGASVRFNGIQIITTAVPFFTLQPGDRYGFGARTGGYNEVNRVDDVMIVPRY